MGFTDNLELFDYVDVSCVGLMTLVFTYLIALRMRDLRNPEAHISFMITTPIFLVFLQIKLIMNLNSQMRCSVY